MSSILIADQILILKSSGLGGDSQTTLNLKDFDATFGAKTIVDTQTTSVNTICNVPQTTKQTTYAQKITLTKKDQTAIEGTGAEDLPNQGSKEMSFIALCEEDVVADFDCGRCCHIVSVVAFAGCPGRVRIFM